MEIMKAVLPILNFGEYAAMKTTGQLIETIENAELRQGYLAQMLDEVRHTNQEAYLMRYFTKHAADPEGFAQGLKSARNQSSSIAPAAPRSRHFSSAIRLKVHSICKSSPRPPILIRFLSP